MRALAFTSATLLLVLASAPAAQQAPDAEPTQLPVRRVVLYKSGVGYFEHLGLVTGSAQVTIQFTSPQLNDVLKSLTALDLDNGQISTISYNSVAPIEQRLGALGLPLGARPDTLQFYNALRGAPVEVRTGTATVTGRLLNIERKTQTSNGQAEQADVLTVITVNGAVHTIPLGPNVTVRIGEQRLRDEIGQYLAVVASARDQDVRRMTLSAIGDGARRLLVSYVSEVPIWKSTYRLVLPEAAADRPILQGWAIVDNTIGEDWTNVELSLVAGAPQSFVQQISQPYYARRPVVPLPQTVLLAPQTHEATLRAGSGLIRGIVRDTGGAVLPGVTVQLVEPATSRIVAETVTDGRGEYELAGAAGTYRLTLALPGFQSTSRIVTAGSGTVQSIDGSMSIGDLSETVTVSPEAPAASVSRSLRAGAGGGVGGGIIGGVVGGLPDAPIDAVRQARMIASAPVATTQELGDLFEYRLAEPVTIRQNQSALVPILHAQVDAERVSIWSRTPGRGRPMRAVWLTNESGLTLDGGTFSVIDANAFAGEGLIEPLSPREKRLISYGTDLAVMVDARLDDASGRYTRVTARDGILTAVQEDRQRWVYRVRNEDTTPRTIIVEHPVREGWTLAMDPAPAEATASSARFRLPVAAANEATLAVTERHVNESRVNIGTIDDRLVATFTLGGIPVEQLQGALQPVFDARGAVAGLERQLGDLNRQAGVIAKDQERVRENMKALRGSREERALVQRYTRELGAQEDRLEELTAQIRTISVERDARQAELSRMIQQLTFEINGQ